MMSTTSRRGHVRGSLTGKSVPWPTIVVLAVVLAYTDGFWLTSLEGAIGAVSRAQQPFANWLLHATLMLPVFALAVARALAIGRRHVGSAPGTLRAVISAAMLVVAAGTLVGIIEGVASTANDFQTQSQQLRQTQSSHFHPTPGQGPVACATCQAESLMLGTDVRAIGLASAVMLATNLVLVGWIVAMRGGRLDTGATGRQVRLDRSDLAMLATEAEAGLS